MKRLDDISYSFKQLKIGGGGFVTGFVFHPKTPDILYARTDVGGIYRYIFTEKKWKCLSYFADEESLFLHFPISIAVDEDNPDRLFAVCGNCSRHNKNYGQSVLLVSSDRGDSFEIKKAPFISHGNFPGRSTAERLAFHDGKLWFGSQGEGLFVSDNLGESWEKVDFAPDAYTLVKFVNDTLIVGTNGENKLSTDRTHTLFASDNFGESFYKLDIPQSLNDERCFHNGFVPVGITADSDKVYITFSHSFIESFGGWENYACDNFGGFSGAVYRYKLTDNGLVFDKDITPPFTEFTDKNPLRKTPCGFGGISVNENILAVCTLNGHPEGIFVSYNNGESYDFVSDRDFQRFEIHDSYLLPEYNGNRLPLHWTSNLQISPFDADFGVFNTGTGIFSIKNLSKGFDKIKIETLNSGHEETVHLKIYGIPSGRNKVLCIVGDLGGFAYRNTDEECENSFADPKGNRYITCINGDFVQNCPDTFIATARGNWTGQTKGGVIYTTDGGENFTHIGYPQGMSETLDEVIAETKKPNVNSGWGAISCDGKAILWTLAKDHFKLLNICAVRYDVTSKSFSKVRILNLEGEDISESENCIKIFSDRLNPMRFYGFGEYGQAYQSLDGGEVFKEISVENLPKNEFSGIDGKRSCEIRFCPDKEGVCYMALWDKGLLKIDFNAEYCEKITDEGDYVKTIGFGKGDNRPSIIVSGKLFCEWGFFKSTDGGKSFAKLDTKGLAFGYITSVDGDMNDENVFYFSTGGFGAFTAYKE